MLILFSGFLMLSLPIGNKKSINRKAPLRRHVKGLLLIYGSNFQKKAPTEITKLLRLLLSFTESKSSGLLTE